MSAPSPAETVETSKPSLLEIFLVALRLGLTSFGGPVAHVGFFRAEYVLRRKWLDDAAFADLLALCQFLPGPASSQLGFSIGLARAGLAGGFLAWLGFTLPSAALMIAFAYGVGSIGSQVGAGGLHGLKIAAVAVVAQAVWAMATRLCPDRARVTLALLAALTILAWPVTGAPAAVIALGAAAGWLLFRGNRAPLAPAPLPVRLSRWESLGSLGLLVGLVLALPALATAIPSQGLRYFDSFYRCGALVFGGGHVILPVLKNEVVRPGWVSENDFLAGYGAAQALPGPLTTFAAFLGTIAKQAPHGWVGGLLCMTAIFLAPILLVIGVIPFWDKLRQKAGAQAALDGANAVVVGVLLAAFYDPVWTSGIRKPQDFGLALVCFGLLVFWNCPPWVVVMLAAAGGWALGLG